VIAFRKKYDKLIFIMFGISTWQRRAIGELASSKQEGLQISPTQPPEMQSQQPQIVVSFDVRRLYFQVAKNHWSLTAFLLALVHSTKIDTGEINKLQKTVQCSMDAAAAKEARSAGDPEVQPNVLDLFDRKTFLQLTRALLLRKNDIPQDVASLLEVDSPGGGRRDRIRLVADFTTRIDSLKPVQTSNSEVPANQPETGPKGAEQPTPAKTDPEGQEPRTPDAAKTEEIQLSSEEARKLSVAKVANEKERSDMPLDDHCRALDDLAGQASETAEKKIAKLGEEFEEAKEDNIYARTEANALLQECTGIGMSTCSALRDLEELLSYGKMVAVDGSAEDYTANTTEIKAKMRGVQEQKADELANLNRHLQAAENAIILLNEVIQNADKPELTLLREYGLAISKREKLQNRIDARKLVPLVGMRSDDKNLYIYLETLDYAVACVKDETDALAKAYQTFKHKQAENEQTRKEAGLLIEECDNIGMQDYHALVRLREMVTLGCNQDAVSYMSNTACIKYDIIATSKEKARVIASLREYLQNAETVLALMADMFPCDEFISEFPTEYASVSSLQNDLLAIAEACKLILNTEKCMSDMPIHKCCEALDDILWKGRTIAENIHARKNAPGMAKVFKIFGEFGR
jgi:hypothetical protein